MWGVFRPKKVALGALPSHTRVFASLFTIGKTLSPSAEISKYPSSTSNTTLVICFPSGAIKSKELPRGTKRCWFFNTFVTLIKGLLWLTIFTPPTSSSAPSGNSMVRPLASFIHFSLLKSKTTVCAEATTEINKVASIRLARLSVNVFVILLLWLVNNKKSFTGMSTARALSCMVQFVLLQR